MKQNIIKATALSLLLACVLALPANAATVGGATVRTAGTGLNLRAAAGTDSASLGLVPSGSFLLVEERLPGWYKVCYNGAQGYVSADYVSFSETLEGTYQYTGAMTLGTDVNLRESAATSSAVRKCINPAGSAVTITGVSGDWLKVTDSAGISGYIRSDYVRYAGIPSAETEGERITAAAMQYLGCSYAWGGMSPTTGFDCSGFVNYVYKQFGYTMERSAQSIYSTNGTAVSKDALQAGDLLFFGWGSTGITHVGLYLGDGQFIHASTSTTGVIISELDSAYYTRKYVGAKRLIG